MVEHRHRRLRRLLAVRALEAPLEVKRLSELMRVRERTVRADLEFLVGEAEETQALRLPSDLAAAVATADTADALLNVHKQLVGRIATGNVTAYAAEFYLNALEQRRQHLRRARAEAPAAKFVAEGLEAMPQTDGEAGEPDSADSDVEGKPAS